MTPDAQVICGATDCQTEVSLIIRALVQCLAHSAGSSHGEWPNGVRRSVCYPELSVSAEGRSAVCVGIDFNKARHGS